MQREVIRWLQSLDLTQQVRYPQQDLSNGFVFAEIASRYDRQVGMHCYVPGCSAESKRSNWKVLLADMKRIGFSAITKETAESIAQGKPGAAITLLNQLYEFFSGRPAPTSSDDFSKKAKALRRALEGPSTSSEGASAAYSKEENHSLPLLASETRIDERLRQPGFAQPTAAALLRVVNSGARSVCLAGAVPPDEVKTRRRNEDLLLEHEMLYKACKRTEPDRFEPKKRPHTDTVVRPKKQVDSLKTKQGVVPLNIGGSTVHLELPNDQVADLLRLRPTADGFHAVAGEQYTGNTTDMQVFNIFRASGTNLRLCLSKLLGIVLCTGKLSIEPLRLNDDVGAGDVFSAFVGQCNSLPLPTAGKCWEAVSDASEYIAQVLLDKPTEYFYLLRVMDFLFSSESMGIRMLHVPGASTAEHLGAAEELTSTSNCTRSEVSRSTSKKYSSYVTVLEDPCFTKHSQQQSARAFNLAAAHGFLYNIGLAVNNLSPSLASSLIADYYLPAVSPSLPTASSMALEGVCRLVVAHLCGDSSSLNAGDDDAPLSPHKDGGGEGRKEESCVSEEDEEERGDKRPFSDSRWEPPKQLAAFLTGPLKEAFLPGGVRDVTNSAQRRTQYGLFLYHTLRHVRSTFGGVDLCRNESSVSVSASSAHRSRFHSLTGLGAAGVCASLASSSAKERAVGVATLLELILWDRWDAAIKPLLKIISDTRQDGSFSKFVRPSAETWELRVLLLELFSVAFHRVLLTLADGTAVEGIQNNVEEGDDVSSTLPIVKQVDLHSLEEATVNCMKSFSAAPLMQRELVLQIIGRRLLPEKQRNVAAAWIDCLFGLPADQLEFLLGADPALHLRSWGNNQEMQPTPRGTVSSQVQGSFSSAVRPVACQENRQLSLSGYAAGLSSDFNTSENPGTDVRVLLGRIESAYVVTPLNHTWNVFTVVQTVIIFKSRITTLQLFSVIHAALVSPQGYDRELQSLLMDLRVLGGNDGAASSENGVAAEEVLEVEAAPCDKAMDSRCSSDISAVVPLKELIKCARVGPGADQGKRGDARECDKELSCVVDSYQVPEVAAFSTSYSIKSCCLEEMQQAGEEITGEETDAYVELFWLSVLRRIKPQLEECTADEKSDHEHGSYSQQSQQNRRKRKDVDREATSWNMCRVSKGEDTKRLRRLANSILLNFFRRFGGTRSRSARPSSLDATSRARGWLSAM